ncbi:MAG TPA: ABC transporter permease [Thermoanaerobaculia bacterium]|nr:ABC transporter permease [Thermoanaerobaculia bacterium]
MSAITQVRERLRTLVFRAREERELAEELEFHLEMEAASNRGRGMSPEEARRAAFLSFGGVERTKEEVRDGWGIRVLEELAADIRFGWRTLRKSPSFAWMTVLTLALGIGANTAMFSVVNGVLLRPLPFPQPDRLLSLFPEAAIPHGGLEILRERTRSYDHLAAYGFPAAISLTGSGEPERLVGMAVTPDLFATLGVGAEIGRPLQPGEEGAGRDHVVVLSHGLWERRFGANPAVVGSMITLGGVDRLVVGVMPASFTFPSSRVDLWLPAPFAPNDIGIHWAGGWLHPVGRLRAGATTAQAAAEIHLLVPAVRNGFPWHMPADWGANATAIPLRDAIVGDVRTMLLVLLGAVGLVLLVACVNVGNLLLARAATRQREVGVRSALGAGRGRLVRQLLTESLLLSLLGAAAGLLLARLAMPVLTSLLPADMPRLENLGIDARVLGFTLALATATGIAFGLAPALRAFRPDAYGELREGGGAGESRRRWHLVGGLVAAEIALAVILVIGALLLVQSLWHLLEVDPGFRKQQILSAAVSPSEVRYTNDVQRAAFYEELLRRSRVLPGARSVAVGSGMPFGGGIDPSVFLIEGRPAPGVAGTEWPTTDACLTVSREYFHTLDIPLLRGRLFTPADGTAAPRVALVSRKLAETYWPGEDVLGKRFRFPGSHAPWWTIVGVVGDVKWNRLSLQTNSGLYLPLLQGPIGAMRIIVRSAATADAVTASLRHTVTAIDRSSPVSNVRTMEELLAASVAQPRSIMLLLALFAAIGLALGAIGIYGVITYAVNQRTREIGIRMALGAQTGSVLRLVLKQGAALAALGIALGLPIAVGATRVLRSLLFGVSATDPLTFAAVPLLLAAVALLASYLPARRASQVDPTTAIRTD